MNLPSAHGLAQGVPGGLVHHAGLGKPVQQLEQEHRVPGGLVKVAVLGHIAVEIFQVCQPVEPLLHQIYRVAHAAQAQGIAGVAGAVIHHAAPGHQIGGHGLQAEPGQFIHLAGDRQAEAGPETLDADGKIAASTLVAAKEAGVDTIYKVGGAQAIAALAFGTESIPKVDKIVGPGNIYVALAKKAVFGHVSIDSIAGPSEILVLADETANPEYVAADLLSQAEHDEMASAILITTSRALADQVSKEIDYFVARLSRKAIIEKSLENYGYILVAPDMETAIDTVNEIASEHLEIVTKNPFDTMTRVKNAGAIFLGEYSSEPLGDYFAGPNHVLPTNGTAKFFSALSVDDFIKKSSIISYSREALEDVYRDIVQFAECEQLTAHANSIKVRFEDV